MPQDVVGRSGVEIEVGQAEIEQQRLASELALAASKLDSDFLVLSPIDLRQFNAFDKFDCLGDAIFEFGYGIFGVGEATPANLPQALIAWSVAARTCRTNENMSG